MGENLIETVTNRDDERWPPNNCNTTVPLNTEMGEIVAGQIDTEIDIERERERVAEKIQWASS